jgi:hypothetical protein
MKELLLNYVEEIGKNVGFWERDEQSRGSEIGSGNIRGLATMANNADCYEEFKLFIEYKTAKGNGWDRNFAKGKKFGDLILEYMDNIYKKCDNDDEEALKSISKFFGYLYWKRYSLEKTLERRR